MSFDPYRILQVSRTACADEIRRAFLDLAREVHPDLNRSQEATALFQLLDRAYRVLGDAKRRQLYDRFGDLAVRMQFDPARIQREQVRLAAPRDVDGLSDVLGGARRSRPPAPAAAPAAGNDVNVALQIDAGVAARGGRVQVASPVGGGLLSVTIPPGTQDGARLRLVGKGRAGARGRPGDLYLQITVRRGEGR